MTLRGSDWIVRVFSPLAVIAGISATLTWYGYDRLTDPGPPLSILAAEVQTPKVQPGDQVQIMFTLDRNRTCPAQIVGFMIEPNRNDHAVTRFDPLWGGYSPIGIGQKVLVTRPAPSTPGRYCYRATITHFCGDKFYETPQPDACFEVVP